MKGAGKLMGVNVGALLVQVAFLVIFAAIFAGLIWIAFQMVKKASNRQ